MGTTSQKLTYLNDTKTQLKDMINYGLDTGEKITSETTFRNYVKSLFDAFIKTMTYPDVLYNNLPKVTGEGTSLSLNDTVYAPMRVELKPSALEQGANPTPDNPQDIHTVSGENTINVTGKNLLPVSLIESQVINGLTITNLGDGTIKVNGTTNTTTRLDVAYSKTLKANTTYTWHNFNLRSSGTNVNIQDGNNILSNIVLNASTNTYTPTTDVSITKMRFYIDSGQSFDNYILKVQLEEGTATTYEPYQSQSYSLSLGDLEYCKIGDYEDSFIRTSGKNLLDKSTIVAGDITGNYATIRLNTRQVLWLKAGTYTVSCNNLTAPFRYGIQVQNIGIPPLNTWPTMIYDDGWKTDASFTFTTTSDGWCNLMLSKENNATLTPNDVKNFNFQLEKGSTATTYEPYGSGEWYLKKNVRHTSLAVSNMNNSDNYPGWQNVPNLHDDYPTQNAVFKDITSIKCNIVTDGNGIAINTMGSGSTLFLQRGVFNNLTETQWKEQYPNLVVEVFYGITPTYTKIEGTLASQLETVWRANSYENQTNVSQTNADLPFVISASAIEDLSGIFEEI